MMLDTSVLILNTDRPVRESAEKLRGYMGKQFPEYTLLHHHTENGFLCTYPKVQYKVIEGTPLMLGIEEGAKILKDISSDIKKLELGNEMYTVSGRQINETGTEVSPKRNYYKYRFITPWFALNQKNYPKFREMENWKEKDQFLNSILIGNILSMCKGLGIIVNHRLNVHSHLKQESGEFKNISFITFTGDFTINFKIPDYFGLGKNASHGYGTVKDITRMSRCYEYMG